MQSVIRMTAESGINNRRTERRKPIGTARCATCVLLHSQPEVREARRHFVSGARIHRRPEQHQTTEMQIVHTIDESTAGTDAARDDI